MEEYNIHLEELKYLDNYFETLKKTGYYSYNEVKKLLVIDFIRELLSPNYNVYITEKDYIVISELLQCYFGSNCLIPYPVFTKNLPIIGKNYTDDDLRIAEDTTLRNTENVFFRIEE
jgi:hypothetical protein